MSTDICAVSRQEGFGGTVSNNFLLMRAHLLPGVSILVADWHVGYPCLIVVAGDMEIEESWLPDELVVDWFVFGQGLHHRQIFASLIAAGSHTQVNYVPLGENDVGDVADIAIFVESHEHIHSATYAGE